MEKSSEPLNLANRPGLQGGIPGSASGNSRDPMTDFMAKMMMVHSQQPREPASAAALAAGAAAPAAGAVAAAAAAESPAAGDSAAQDAG